MIRHLVLWKLTTDDPSEKAQIAAEMKRRFSALLPIIDGTQRPSLHRLRGLSRDFASYLTRTTTDRAARSSSPR